MKKSAIWGIALLAGGALLSLTAGCGGGANDFESKTEKAIRLMDQGKNEEAFSLLRSECGNDDTGVYIGSLTIDTEDYRVCRSLLGDAKAGEAGLNWLDFIAELPSEDSAPSSGTVIVDVIGGMAGADESGYMPADQLAEKEDDIIDALNIHTNSGTATADYLSAEEKAQIALESMLYVLYEISGALAIDGSAPLTVETLKTAIAANPDGLYTIDYAGVNQAITYIDMGAEALLETTGGDNSAAQEFLAFIDEITQGTGVVTSGSIDYYITQVL
jgi:hypothetical protein